MNDQHHVFCKSAFQKTYVKLSQVWASTMNKNVLMGLQNITAKALTCKCSGRTPSPGVHNIRRLRTAMLVQLMMEEMIHKWAMHHTTLYLGPKKYEKIVGSQEIEDVSLLK